MKQKDILICVTDEMYGQNNKKITKNELESQFFF